MADEEKPIHTRGRAHSEAVRPRREAPGSDEDHAGFAPPRRAATAAIASLGHVDNVSSLPDVPEHGTSSLRRRDTALSRMSASRRSATAYRSNVGTVGLAGDQDITQLQATYENFVHPGYAALNPAREQPPASKPIWSLAKPLPRVVRPGMVPTREELLGPRTDGQVPAENVQKLGLDIDPNDLEAGRMQGTVNPAKLSAQLKDSRAQREQNYVSELQRRGTTASRISNRPARASSTASQTIASRRRAGSRVSIAPRPNDIFEVDEETKAESAAASDDGQATEPGPIAPSADQAARLSIPHSPGDVPSTGLRPIPENHEPIPTPRVSVSSERSDGSEATVHDDDAYDGMDELKLEIENPVMFEEIHNNHTSWSIVRTQYREFLAELLAVFVQETIGFAADTNATLSTTSNLNTTAWAWGFATMIGIYISGGISGAHLNPSITIMLWFYRGFPKSKMRAYFSAQFLGAFVAALTAYGMYYASIHNYELTQSPVNILNGFVTGQRHDYIDPATAFFNEFLGTAFLACTVLALGDDQNAPPGAGMNSLIIGFVITALNFAFANQTGFAGNPSRDFGPRLAMLALGYGSDLFTNPYWFYGPWAGSLCGAFVGGALYDVCIFTGGESPINYPWTRTKRSFRKGKVKWARRLHLAKKEKAEELTLPGLEPVGVS